MSISASGPTRGRGAPVLAEPGRPRDAEVTEFFLAHRRNLRRYLIAQGCADSDSDDIVQDAFLIVRERWETICYYDKPKAYLYKVAVRLWRRHAGRQQRGGYRDDHEEYLMAIPDPVDQIGSVELTDILVRWFRQLPTQQRNVAGLRLIAGLSEVETAEVLRVGLGTVKSQLSAARKRLAEFRDSDGRRLHATAAGKEE